MNPSKIQKMTRTALSIVLNVVLGQAAIFLSIPLLFFDTIGTIYAASYLGLSWGIMSGLCTNLVLGLLNGPHSVPFAVVNIAVAIVVWFMVKSAFSVPKAIYTGMVLAIVSALIGTPIQLLLFGGFTGSGADGIIFFLSTTGQSLFISTFFALLISNLVDKTVSCILVALLLSRILK